MYSYFKGVFMSRNQHVLMFFFFHTYEWLVKMSTVVTERSSGAGTVNYQVLLTTETDY